CKGATNDVAQLSGVLMCNSCQDGNFDGKTTRSIFTEFFVFIFLKVLSASTVPIVPIGEVKIDFE
ncbi:hypothetical protein MKX03_001215, partial [Papaver bracteatum]